MQAARARKRNRQRMLVAVVVSILVIGLIASFALTTNEDGQATDVTTEDSKPEADVASAKGKPCVKVADPLPEGAPEVPIQTGPPPKDLVVEDLKEGTGAEVKESDALTVHYIGVSCSTGRIFDSSYSRGEPASFSLSGVISGWTQGIPGMKVGGQRLLGIPSELAYGSEGRAPTIAPDEALWFVVEVLDAKPAS